MTAGLRAAAALLLGWLVLAALPSQAAAHTAGGRILSGKAAITEFRFSDGSPMAFADVKVFAPSSTELWLAGRADGAGRFAFMPDKAGDWTVEAREAEGHTARLTVTIAVGDLATAALIPRYWGFVLLGSVALNLLLLSLMLGGQKSWTFYRRQ
jgi:nickel transport protein